MQKTQFLKKILVGIQRKFDKGVPFTSDNFSFGMNGEDIAYINIKKLLPNCIIYKNVIFNEYGTNGDADLVVIYNKYVFVIEIKTWNGKIYSNNDNFYQDKESSSFEIYTNEMPNPFKQVNNTIFKLKRNMFDIWIEPIVLFLNADSINIDTKDIWFSSTNEVVDYIKHFHGKTNNVSSLTHFESSLKCFDRIEKESNLSSKIHNCVILEDSLSFTIGNIILKKNDIYKINITHHFSYDDVYILTKDGKEYNTIEKRKAIRYMLDGIERVSYLSKIDTIIVG